MARQATNRTTASRQPAKRGATAAKRNTGATATATKRTTSAHMSGGAPTMTVPQARAFLQGKGYQVSKLAGPATG